MKCHGPCGQDKAICLFPPKQMGKAKPVCRMCDKKRQDQYKGRRPGATKGKDLWRVSMPRHFFS